MINLVWLLVVAALGLFLLGAFGIIAIATHFIVTLLVIAVILAVVAVFAGGYVGNRTL